MAGNRTKPLPGSDLIGEPRILQSHDLVKARLLVGFHSKEQPRYEGHAVVEARPALNVQGHTACGG